MNLSRPSGLPAAAAAVEYCSLSCQVRTWVADLVSAGPSWPCSNACAFN